MVGQFKHVNRRANGDGGLSWDQRRQRWIAVTTVGYDDGRGKRIVRSRCARTKALVAGAEQDPRRLTVAVGRRYG